MKMFWVKNQVNIRRFGDAGKAGIKRAMAAGSKVKHTYQPHGQGYHTQVIVCNLIHVFLEASCRGVWTAARQVC